MPSLWMFQIGFQAIAPIVDIGIVWTWLYGKFIAPQNDHNGVIMLLGYWAISRGVIIEPPAVVTDFITVMTERLNRRRTAMVGQTP